MRQSVHENSKAMTDRMSLKSNSTGIVTVCLAILAFMIAGVGWSRTVGLWKIAPKYVNDTMLKTLEDAGWQVVIVESTDLADGAVLNSLDALFLPGGWEPYKYAGFKVRRNLVRFAAGGKGLLDSDILTSRSLFPQVGTTVRDVVRGVRIAGAGKSALAQGLNIAGNDKVLAISTNMILREVKAGPEGEVFAKVHTSDVGVSGKAYGGRYVLFGGSFIRLEFKSQAQREKAVQQVLLTDEESKALMEQSAQQDITLGDSALQDLLPDLDGKSAPEQELKAGDVGKDTAVKSAPVTQTQQLLLNCLDWVASAPALDPAERSRLQTQADLDFLRREKLCDWTRHDYWTQIVGKEQSLVPEVRGRLASPLEKRLYTLSCLAKSLSGENLSRCQLLSNELRQALDEMDVRYQKVLSEMESSIGEMDTNQLADDNPFVDPVGVRSRIEAASGHTQAEKEEMLDMVQRCASENPPPDAPQRVAMYLNGPSIAEQIMPRERIRELTDRCDKAIQEFQRAAETLNPVPPATIEERMRIDPLMMPYYTGHILPTPQKAEYRDEFLPMGKVAIVVGKDVENPAVMVDILQDRLTRYGGAGTVMDSPGSDTTAVISLGDTVWAGKAKDVPAIPARKEGYILHTTNVDGMPVVILKGHDRLGLVWAIAGEIQLIHWRNGKTMSRAATVEDFPVLAKRGMILSGSQFHSNGEVPSSARRMLQQNRMLMLVSKVNEPFYSHLTVADLNWKYLWKYPDRMPADARIEEDIAAMGENLTPLGITWWGGLHPHETYASTPDYLARKVSGDEESVNALLYYARLMEKAGGHLAIILDDCRFPLSPYDQEHHLTGRVSDTWFLTRVMNQLKKEFPKPRLLVCPPFYWGPGGQGWWVYGEDRTAYLKMVGAEWPPEIEVFWSGATVNGDALARKDHVDWITGLIKRKPYFWQNNAAYRRHLYRRCHPTDWVTLSWYYWDGFMDSIGWYAFNGAGIARYGITETLAADFQWNPKVYCADQRDSARRSAIETADKFVGQNAWSNMCAVTIPLAAFDPYFPDADKGNAAADVARKEAAKNYDVLEAGRNQVMTAFKNVKEKYPASISAWTELEGFIAIANMVDKIKADPGLAPYRTAAQQRAHAGDAGDYSPENNDYFLAASSFEPVSQLAEIKENPMDDLLGSDDDVLCPALILNAQALSTKVEQWFRKADLADQFELRISARKGPEAENVVVSINGKELFNAPTPFSGEGFSTLRMDLPEGLLKEKDNTLKIRVVKSVGEPGEKSAEIPPLAIQYAVFKRTAKGKP